MSELSNGAHMRKANPFLTAYFYVDKTGFSWRFVLDGDSKKVVGRHILEMHQMNFWFYFNRLSIFRFYNCSLHVTHEKYLYYTLYTFSPRKKT